MIQSERMYRGVAPLMLCRPLAHAGAAGDPPPVSAADRVDDFARPDLRLAKTLQLGSTAARLALIVQNLGVFYQEFNAENTFDTCVFGRVSLDLP